MPKLTGIFDTFKNLGQIPVEDIARWIKPVPNYAILQNFIANRILYPQAIPISETDVNMDLGLLREALLRDKSFISETSHKIIIPYKFFERIPDLKKLAWAFIDAYLLGRKMSSEVWTIILKGEAEETIGSCILPEFQPGGEMIVDISGKISLVKQGGLVLLPCSNSKCQIGFRIKNGQILGKQVGAIEVWGGKLGLLIDTRL